MANTPQNPQQPHEHEDEVAAMEPSGEEFYDVDDEENGDEEEESFTCEICIEPTKKSTHTITSCAHRYCVDCTIKYIKVKIEDDNEAQIKCPAPSCTRTLDPVACAPLVGLATFVWWCDVLCRSALSGADACYCPYSDCSELLLSSDCAQRGSKKPINYTKNKSQCPMCKRWFCSACEKAWHAGFGCDDVPTDSADVEFGRLAERMTWTRCPSCRHFVELRGGCRIVTCRCGIGFCYKCGNKIQRCSCHKSRAHVVEDRFSLMCFLALVILAFGAPFYLPILLRHCHFSN